MKKSCFVQGASRGIGLAFVQALLARPDVERVFAASRTATRAEELDALEARAEGRLARLDVDVTDEGSLAAAAEGVKRTTDRLHVLVNTAGVLHDDRGLAPERKLASVNRADLERGFAVNAFGPILLAKHFADLLAHEERAVFASLSARVGSISDNRLGGWYTYRASKAAQNQLLKTLSIEWARRARNVVVLGLHPGTVDTGLSKPFQRGVKPEKLFTPEHSVEKLLPIVEGATAADSGKLFAWDGTEIPG